MRIQIISIKEIKKIIKSSSKSHYPNKSPTKMALSPKLQKRFFPSYNQIHQTIVKEHKHQHEKRIFELQKKIHYIQQTFDLNQQHQEIKRRLLANCDSQNRQDLKDIVQSLNDREQKLEKQKQSHLWNARLSSFGNSSSNAYSLNYGIDDDIEDDKHYENHLKFKKQVLERDLFENVNLKPDKKKQLDEEYIFKNLYNPRPATAFEMGLKDKLKIRKPLKKNYLASENTKQFKENINQFKKHHLSQNFRKMELNCWSSSKNRKQTSSPKKKEVSPSNVKKCLRKEQSQDQFTEQHEICQKNTKILKDSYGKYLRELSDTNIIKWRVLGGEKQKQREVIRTSINASGLSSSAINGTIELQALSTTLKPSQSKILDSIKEQKPASKQDF